jgi:CHAD domain-containing protein
LLSPTNSSIFNPYSMTPSRPSKVPNYLRKLRRLLREVSSQPLPERVHQLRTTIRRAETFLSSQDLPEKRDVGKLLQQLSKLRRRAGRVRDIDVQAAALRTVNIGQEEAKARVLAELEEQRSRKQKKLLAGIEDKFSLRMRSRMSKVESAVASAGEARVAAGKKSKPTPRRLWRSLRDLIRTAGQTEPFTPRTLHQFRVQCKKTRYLAELLAGNAALLEQLKTIQDAIGDWHDWLTLTQSAAKIASPTEVSLLAHLENVSQAKFTEAIRTSRRIVPDLELAASALKAELERQKAEKKAERAKKVVASKKTPLQIVPTQPKQVTPAAG